jgi:hypothetical protein
VTSEVRPAAHERFELDASAGEPTAFVRFALARFDLAGSECELYRLEAYGGGRPFSNDS